MRCSPLAIWGHKLDYGNLSEVVKQEIQLTHVNSKVIDCGIVYISALVHLLNHLGDSEGAHAKALSIAKETKEWLEGELPAVNENIGHSKIAFTYSFWYLKNIKKFDTFESVLKDILIKGGDSDTNGAIVGAFIGAYTGYSNLPKE